VVGAGGERADPVLRGRQLLLRRLLAGLVLLTGAALCAAGYLPMWLAVAGVVPAPLPLVCLYMLLASQAQTFMNTADVVTAVENFPDRRGTVIGIMKVLPIPSYSVL
jgi:hypothetical protein